MYILVNGEMKELEVKTINGVEFTEDFMSLANLLVEGEVWKDDKENFCMSDETFAWWKNVCALRNEVTDLESCLEGEDATDYQKYLDELYGYDLDSQLEMMLEWLEQNQRINDVADACINKYGNGCEAMYLDD